MPQSNVSEEPFIYPLDREYTPAREWVIPAVFLILALATRFLLLGSKDLWFDEVQSVYDGMYPRERGMSHWLFFHLMEFFRGFVNDVTLGVRIYPALLGALAVPMMYWVGRRLWSVEAGVVAAAILLTSPFHLYYSQEARYYAPMVFYSLLAIWMVVEFTTRTGRWRFLLLPVAGLACWLNVVHHPATIPFVAAFSLVGVLVLCLSNVGLDALRELIPPLRRIPAIRWVLLGAGLITMGLSLVILTGLRERVYTSLFESPWGETPNVEFTWQFFQRHLEEYGWNLTHWGGGVRLFGAIVSLLLVLAGLVLLLMRRTAIGLIFPATIVASFLAIFAYSLPDATYLVKYSCAIMAPMVLLAGVAIGTGLRATSRWTNSINPRAHLAATGAVALLLAIGQSSGMMSSYTLHKMPIRPQLEWVNEHHEEPTRVFVYGHAAYVAAIYADTLDPRHELVYIPRNTRSLGHQEVEQILGAALDDGHVYFAKAWHWDIPPVLGEFLEEYSTVVETFRSFEHPTQSGFLHRIQYTGDENDSVFDRPGGAISDAPIFPRPKVDKAAPTGQRGLELRTATRVEYDIPTDAGKTYRFEVDINPGLPRIWAFSIEDKNNTGLVFLIDDSQSTPTTLRGYITTEVASATLVLTHLTDLQQLGIPDRGLVIDRLRVTEVDRPGQPSPGVFPMPALQEFPIGPENNPLHGWTMNPPENFTVAPGDDGAMAVVTLEEGPDGSLITPAISIPSDGALLMVRAGVRSVDLFGAGGNAVILFLNEQGQAIGQEFLASRSWSSTIRWHLVERALYLDNGWHHFDGLRPIPPGTSHFAISFPLWKADGRWFPDAANELHLAPIQLGVLSPEGL
ncbi:MAG: glycosyltransferase family 39 protein [Candidatus Sumerlaeia bacterium]|nr:glycosyltransferase family 39 protein [Candidatus Sumerlaeia bacterium]